MWGNKIYINFFLCPRLSGEFPFQGNSDAETLVLVTAASYEFDEESFEDISEQAKDFIRSLLKKDRRCAKITVFVTVHACVCVLHYLVHYLMQLIMSHQSKIFVVTFAAYLLTCLGTLRLLFSVHVAFQMPAVVHRGPCPPLDDLVHPID